MSENNTNKMKFVNNSIISHIRYKIYIWMRKYPMIVERLFGINQRYIVMRLNILESMVIYLYNLETIRKRFFKLADWSEEKNYRTR